MAFMSAVWISYSKIINVDQPLLHLIMKSSVSIPLISQRGFGGEDVLYCFRLGEHVRLWIKIGDLVLFEKGLDTGSGCSNLTSDNSIYSMSKSVSSSVIPEISFPKELISYGRISLATSFSCLQVLSHPGLFPSYFRSIRGVLVSLINCWQWEGIRQWNQQVVVLIQENHQQDWSNLAHQ